MISFYNATNPEHGYNVSFGGGGTFGVKLSDETKQKISNSHKGKRRSEESKRKQSETLKGHVHSEETKKKIGEANSRRVWSEESRRKSSESHKGIPAYNRRKVLCVETGIVYDSMHGAAKAVGLKSHVSISQACSGKTPSRKAGGYTWKYYDDVAPESA